MLFIKFCFYVIIICNVLSKTEHPTNVLGLTVHDIFTLFVFKKRPGDGLIN